MRPRFQKGEQLDWLPGAWAGLWAAARAAYPREGCGVLLGDVHRPPTDLVTGVLPLTNLEPGEVYFHIDPLQLAAVYDAEDRGALSLLGFWHSHPRTSSQPSALDRSYSVPGYAYVVAGVDGAYCYRVSELA